MSLIETKFVLVSTALFGRIVLQSSDTFYRGKCLARLQICNQKWYQLETCYWGTLWLGVVLRLCVLPDCQPHLDIISRCAKGLSCVYCACLFCRQVWKQCQVWYIATEGIHGFESLQAHHIAWNILSPRWCILVFKCLISTVLDCFNDSCVKAMKSLIEQYWCNLGLEWLDALVSVMHYI